MSCLVVSALASTVHSSFLLFFSAVTQDRSFQHCKLFLILIINQVKSSPSLQLHVIINISGDFWVELPSWKWRVLTAYNITYTIIKNTRIYCNYQTSLWYNFNIWQTFCTSLFEVLRGIIQTVLRVIYI